MQVASQLLDVAAARPRRSALAACREGDGCAGRHDRRGGDCVDRTRPGRRVTDEAFGEHETADQMKLPPNAA